DAVAAEQFCCLLRRQPVAEALVSQEAVDDLAGCGGVDSLQFRYHARAGRAPRAVSGRVAECSGGALRVQVGGHAPIGTVLASSVLSSAVLASGVGAEEGYRLALIEHDRHERL